MKTAVEGIYNEGTVTLNEPIPFSGNSKILVVFMEDFQDKAAK